MYYICNNTPRLQLLTIYIYNIWQVGVVMACALLTNTELND